jgi:hypothetical protein
VELPKNITLLINGSHSHHPRGGMPKNINKKYLIIYKIVIFYLMTKNPYAKYHNFFIFFKETQSSPSTFSSSFSFELLSIFLGIEFSVRS